MLRAAGPRRRSELVHDVDNGGAARHQPPDGAGDVVDELDPARGAQE